MTTVDNHLVDLAAEITPGDARGNVPDAPLRLRRGTVAAVDRATNTYQVTLAEVAVPPTAAFPPGVPALSGVFALVGDVVEVLMDGPGPRIVGVIGALTWHIVGTGSEPALVNGWGNYGGSEPVAAFLRDSQGIVHMRGTISAGSAGTVAFTLPAGFRPSARENFAVSGGSGAYGFLVIDTSGTVTPTTVPGGVISLKSAFAAF